MPTNKQKEMNEVLIPSPTDFYFNLGLYKAFTFKSEDEGNFEKLQAIINFDGRLDAYCPFCNDGTIYYRAHVGTNMPSRWPSDTLLDGVYRVRLACARNSKHIVIFQLRTWDAGFMKIGQWPSLADISIGEYARFSKLLDESQRHEFNKALGLYSHGVGIGSYVYLRRIFENLIEGARKVAAHSGEEISDSYATQRMEDKIKIIEKYLPKSLVKNRNIYSILSHGIHELGEEDCLRYFPVIKNGIVMILEEELERKRQEQQEVEMAKDIAQIKQSLRSKDLEES